MSTNMEFTRYGNPRAPFFTLGRFAIHLTQIMVMMLVVSMLVCLVMGISSYSELMMFTTHTDLQKTWWTVFSYLWFADPTVGFIFSLVIFAIFGSRVEERTEPAVFALICAMAWLMPPLVLLACQSLGPAFLLGPQLLGMLVFLIYCLMNPEEPFFFGIRLKWIALIVLLGTAGSDIVFRQWSMLAMHVVVFGTIWALLRHQNLLRPLQLADELGLPEMKSRPKKPVTARQEPKIKPRTVIDLKATNAMDRILDKVREKGLHSLTEKEKKLLMEISREQQGGES